MTVGGDDKIFLLDELTLKEGQLDAFLAAFEQDYRGIAEARAMTLEHLWVSPPFDAGDMPLRVLLVWSIEGVAGFWSLRSRGAEPEVGAWWRRCDELVHARSRSVAVEAEALSRFENAGREHA